MKIFYLDYKDLIVGIIVLIAISLIVPAVTFATYTASLATPESIMNNNNTGFILTDRHGTPFFTFYSAHQKKSISLEEIPKHMIKAILASEDKEFYSHPGFSVRAIIGAAIADFKHRSLKYGGSTITQQLVKNALLNDEKDFLRKYQEVILAQEIERKYTKDQILEMYVNSVYFGEGSFGILDASENYFGKPPKELTVGESAILAALLPAPSRLSPLNGGMENLKKRQEYILDEMAEQHFITPEEKINALAEKIEFKPPSNELNKTAPHFAVMVRDKLIEEFGEEKVTRSGFVVKTSIDLNWQQYAEKAVHDSVDNLKRSGVTNGAAVVIDPKTSEILAMVGSIDWNNEKFGKMNMAITPRQVGSAFKPLIYAAALEDGTITASTTLKDMPSEFPEDNNPNSFAFKNKTKVYRPRNYDGRFRGNVTVRRALANSLNVPSVEVLSKLGIPEAVEKAKLLGITTLNQPSDYGLSFVLGAAEVKLLDLTNAYAVFANGGFYNPPTSILQIQDKRGQIIQNYTPNPKKVLEDGAAYIITSILSDRKTRGEVFGSSLNISKNAAVKTGTTTDYKDALTVGYTPNLVVGVWVGNSNNRPMDQVAGSLGAAPIWKSLMEKYSTAADVEDFKLPSDIVALNVCAWNGLPVRGNLVLANEAPSFASQSAVYKEYFLKGTEPVKYCMPQKPSPSPNASPSQTTIIIRPTLLPLN